MQVLLGAVAALASIGIAYAKRTADKKGVSEEQVDVVLDFVEEFATELETRYPGVKDFAAFRKHIRKLRRMWNNEKVTTDDLLDYLDGLKG